MNDVSIATEVTNIKTAPTQRRGSRVNRNIESGAQSEIDRKYQEKSETQSRERDERRSEPFSNSEE